MSPLGDVGVATTDRDLVIRSWDDWLVRATSISRDDAVGRHLSAIIPAFEERDLRARFEATLQSGAVQIFSSRLHHPLLPCPPRFTRAFSPCWARTSAKAATAGAP